jgi:hypothetical protein
MMSGLHENTELTRRSAELADTVVGDESSFDDVRRRAEPQYQALLHAVRAAHERFAFDRVGRPGAVHAVREALPAMEREVFDAVLDDHACELAAVEEALYQFARALARSR